MLAVRSVLLNTIDHWALLVAPVSLPCEAASSPSNALCSERAPSFLMTDHISKESRLLFSQHFGERSRLLT